MNYVVLYYIYYTLILSYIKLLDNCYCHDISHHNVNQIQYQYSQYCTVTKLRERLHYVQAKYIINYM